MPTALLDNKSPFEVLHELKPTYDHLRTFGYLYYASTLKRHKEKLQPRAHPCIFLGYPYGQKAYKLLDLTTNRIFTSRDVIFHEQIFPYQQFQHKSDIPLPTVIDLILENTNFQEPDCNFFTEQSTSSYLSPDDTSISLHSPEYVATTNANADT